jgi:hypothetical protein
MFEGAVVVATSPARDALEGSGGASPAVDCDGRVVALGASGLLHKTVYGTRGFKPCTVYGDTMESKMPTRVRLSPEAVAHMKALMASLPCPCASCQGVPAVGGF